MFLGLDDAKGLGRTKTAPKRDFEAEAKARKAKGRPNRSKTSSLQSKTPKMIFTNFSKLCRVKLAIMPTLLKSSDTLHHKPRYQSTLEAVNKQGILSPTLYTGKVGA